MTGDERFRAVIHHEKPDKLPLFIPTVACTVASELLGRPAYTGADSLHFAEELAVFKGPQAHAEFERQHMEDLLELYRTLRVDIAREAWRSRAKASVQVDENTLLFGDEHGYHTLKRFYPETQSYGVMKNTHPPLTGEDILAMVEKELEKPLPAPAMQAAKPGSSSAHGLIDRFAANGWARIVGGFDMPIPMYSPEWLEAMALAPELLREYVLRFVPGQIARMEAIADQGFVWFSGGGDMASSRGPILSPKMFRLVFLDALKLCSEACNRRGTVFCYRTDGNIWPVFDTLFAEAGVQAYGEVDRDAGMTVAEIRRRNPNLLILGNMSSALLHEASPERVREETRTQLEESEGRNFIPGPSNAIVHGTPIANIFAMIEEIERFKP